MPIPIILNNDDQIVKPAAVGIIFFDRAGNCRQVNSSPSEQHAFARKMASNRGHLSKNYEVRDVVVLPLELLKRIGDFLDTFEGINPEAKAILDSLRGGGEEDVSVAPPPP